MSTSISRIDPALPGGIRYYAIDGHRYPSVTSIIAVAAKPGLIPWAKNVALEQVRMVLLTRAPTIATALLTQSGEEWLTVVDRIITEAKGYPERVRDEAASHGLRLHRLIEEHLKGKKPVVPDDLAAPYQAFNEWLAGSGLEITASERVVWCNSCLSHFGYAGTLDIQASTGRDARGTNYRVVIDIKTGNAVYDEHLLQVAAYAHALEIMNDGVVERAIVLRLGKDKPEFEAHTFSHDELFEAFHAFSKLLDYWHWKHYHGERRT